MNRLMRSACARALRFVCWTAVWELLACMPPLETRPEGPELEGHQEEMNQSTELLLQ
jgi:hypothetical protein